MSSDRIAVGERVRRRLSIGASGWRYGVVVARHDKRVGIAYDFDMYSIRWDDYPETVSHGYLRVGLERVSQGEATA